MRGRLEGRRILVLRPQHQADDLASALTSEGAEPVVVPAIRIVPVLPAGTWERVVGEGFDWVVFTSVNGVAATGCGPTNGGRPRVAAVGPATAEALASAGVQVDFVPSAYTTSALASELPGPVGRVCVVRAASAGPDLETILAGRGFEVERLDAYATEAEPAGGIVGALETGVDAVALTSASIAEAYAAAAGGAGPAAVFSIGPATTAAARSAGLSVTAEARTHTIPGLVETIAATMGR